MDTTARLTASWVSSSTGAATAASSWPQMESSSPSPRSSLANSVHGSGDPAMRSHTQHHFCLGRPVSSPRCHGAASLAIHLPADPLDGWTAREEGERLHLYKWRAAGCA